MRVWGERPQKSCVNVNSFTRGFGLVLPGPTDRPTPPKKVCMQSSPFDILFFFFFRRALLRSTDDGWDSRRGCLCVCVCVAWRGAIWCRVGVWGRKRVGKLAISMGKVGRGLARLAFIDLKSSRVGKREGGRGWRVGSVLRK